MSTATMDDVDEIRELRQEVQEQKDRIESLESELSQAEDDLEEIRDKHASSADMEAAIDAVLDEVERPVGKLTPYLPRTAASERALMRLFDAAGRNP